MKFCRNVHLPPDRTAVIYKLLFSLSLVALNSVFLAADQPRERSIRVLTYNIHHGEGTDGKIDLPRLAKVIREANPDFVALQEVDRNTQRSGNVDQTAELARLTEMNGYFFQQIDYDGGEYGQAILAKSELIERAQEMLPGEPEREQRLLARGLFQVGGTELWFATTHLHHADRAIREEQVDALNQLFDKLSSPERPAIVCGDFNASPKSEALKSISQVWKISGAGKSLFTFPAEKPTSQIDYVIVRPANVFHIISATVIPEEIASDHCPFLVEIAVTPLLPDRNQSK
ncbi:endonuclease [Bremerella cremea]|uniref:Endonuclease n=1 Tax=Bremerella cremea TaxID=1031537 RepID=A0A368KUB5_9BACT|nr:endonuclease/exonuclease/phosphatase family protein [Bremerella cremea]RCS53916.1 endonuclease [Bremerella cremea]